MSTSNAMFSGESSRKKAGDEREDEKEPVEKKPALFNALPSLPKTNPPQSFKTVETVRVATNMFEIDTSKMPEKLRRFEVDIFLTTSDGKHWPQNKYHIGSDLYSHFRREAHNTIVKKCLEKSGDVLDNGLTTSVVYDGFRNIFMKDEVYIGSNEEPVKVTLAMDQFSADEQKVVKGGVRTRNGCNVFVKMTPSEHIYTRGPNFLQEKNKEQFKCLIETLITQNLKNSKYYTFGSSLYAKEPLKKANAMCDVNSGIEIIVHIGDGSEGEPRIMFTIDQKIVAFYKGMSALKFIYCSLKELENNKNTVEMEDDEKYVEYEETTQDLEINEKELVEVIAFFKNPRDKKIDDELRKCLKGIFACSTRAPTVPLPMSGITSTDSRDTTFQLKTDGGIVDTSVYDYFESKGITLRYPDLPLAFTGPASAPRTFHPLETFYITRGQQNRATKFKKLCDFTPHEHANFNEDDVTNILQLHKNLWMDGFGVKLASTKPVYAEATVLPPPLMKYGNMEYMADMKEVKKNVDGTFVKAAVVDKLAIIIFDDALSKEEESKFREKFAAACVENGIQCGQEPLAWPSARMGSDDTKEIEKKMMEWGSEKVGVLLAICKTPNTTLHEFLKYREEASSIVTMQLVSKTVQMMLEEPSSTQSVEAIRHLMTKFNLKCGGLTFEIDIPHKTILDELVCDDPIILRDRLFRNTQFIGIDIINNTFGQPEKVTEYMTKEPWAVGIAYSLKSCVQLGGLMDLQPSIYPTFHQPGVKIAKCVEAFRAEAKRLPSKIVIYRRTSGELEIPQVREEIEDIRKSFAKIQRGYHPKLIFLADMKKSPIKMYLDDKTVEGNVPTGTCLETTAFGGNEFILKTMTPLKGLARCSRYIILANNSQWTKKEIEHVTYFLGVAHQSYNAPTSYPNVLYSAAALSNRVKNNFATHRKFTDMQQVEDRLLREEPDLVRKRHLLSTKLLEEVSTSINNMKIKEKPNFWA